MSSEVTKSSHFILISTKFIQKTNLLLKLLGGQAPTDPLGANPLASNPLLAAAGGGLPLSPSEPATQFVTHSSTYTTTITNTESTVLGITLRGREIKTTVIESSTEIRRDAVE